MEKKYKIVDIKEINLQEEIFAEAIENLNSRKYTSLMEERKRLNKMRLSTTIKKPIEDVFDAFIKISIEDMNPNLTVEEIKQDSYYKSSKKNNRIIFRVRQFEKNKIFQIEWIANKQWFSKTVTFSCNKNNTITKIKFYDFVKGDTSIVGFFERHILNVYLKKQRIAFYIQILKCKIKLKIFDESKSEKVKKRIVALIEYSKKLF